MDRTKITPNFERWEFTLSETAARHGISNEPDDAAWQRIELLCKRVLEPVREQFGPVRVTSGYRSPQVNRLIGGAPVLTRSVITDLREGQIAKALGQLQDQYPDISIGSYPFFKNRRFGVNVILRGTHAGSLDNLEQAVQAMVRELGGELLDLQAAQP